MAFIPPFGVPPTSDATTTKAGKVKQPLTTKGDVQTYSTDITRLGVGTDGQMLVADSDENEGVAWGDPALVLIGDSTLASAAASITFSSIPATYKHLRLEVGARSTHTAVTNISLRFNSDSAANYDYQYLYTNNTTVGGQGFVGVSFGLLGAMCGTNTRALMEATTDVIIPNYAGTTLEKAYFSCNGFADSTAANSYIWNNAGSWRSTAAINSVTVFCNVANFAIGTRATLYGFN